MGISVKIDFSKHTCWDGDIYKVELGILGWVDDEYSKDLYELIAILCAEFGFTPELGSDELTTQINTFITKAGKRSICLIIDKTGLFIKDINSAEKYIKKANVRLFENGPILGVIG